MFSTLESRNAPVIVDVRQASSAAMSHIPGSVSIPWDVLLSSKNKFPAEKKTPIVLCGKSSKDSLGLFPIIRGWGYSNVTVLKGGFDKWLSEGLPLENKPPITTINHIPTPTTNVLSVSEFTKAVETKDPNVIFIDVRTDEEVESGKIPGALAIPVDELLERINEIPRGKRVYAYCSAGIRAEMASLILKKNGYNVSYLDSQLIITEQGEYTILEN